MTICWNWPEPDLTDINNPKYPRINAFRAYFDLTDGNAGVREFKLNFGDNESQGITTA